MEDGIIISRGMHVREQPKVSIIMPAYNTAQFITEALQSVAAQTYADFEAIVVNDGSPDTEELEKALAPYRDRIVYIVQKNKRAAGARNTGIRVARGEYLAFLDSDDSLTPGALAAQMKQFEGDPRLDMVFADSRLIGEASGSGRTCMELCPSHGPVSFESLVDERTQVCIVGAVARKAIVEKVGLFDESLRSWDDYDMWLRIAHAGGKVSYHQTVIGNSRVGRPGSLGASELALGESVMKILSGLERKLTLSDEQKVLVRRRIAFHQAHYDRVQARMYLHQGDYGNAATSLAKANSFFKSPKMGLALLLMKSSPKLVQMISRARNPD